MGRRRKALESSLELLEDQFFQALKTMESFRRLARTIRDQLVSGECLELLSDLGEEIQAWASYSDFAYRHLEEWLVYAEEREIAALERLLRRACPKACQAGEAKADDQKTELGRAALDGKVANRGLVLSDQVGMVILGPLEECRMQMITPLYERGHYCEVCQRQTIHHYLGPQRDRKGEVALHLWNCSECKATVSLDLPEEFANGWFRIHTRGLRQRRSRRRYG